MRNLVFSHGQLCTVEVTSKKGLKILIEDIRRILCTLRYLPRLDGHLLLNYSSDMNGMVHYNFKFIYMFMFSEFLDKNLYMKYVPS